jgi:RNA polymerase sigma-70 factor, ECF subfamily
MRERAELELITHSRNGDSDAMDELFRRHYSSSIGVARGMLPSQDEFLDAVQSAYLAAFRNFDSFRGEASFKSWITRIVINQCLMRLREPARHRPSISLDHSRPDGTSTVVVDRAPTPEDHARTAEIRKALLDAVSKLPAHFRDVTRCSLSGLSVQETARALGLTEQVTKTRLFRARSRMRSELRAFRTNGGRHSKDMPRACSGAISRSNGMKHDPFVSA